MAARQALVEKRAKEVGASLDVQVANGDDAVRTKQSDDMMTMDRSRPQDDSYQ